MMTLSGALKEKLSGVELEILLVKKVVVDNAHDTNFYHKVKVPKPKSFGCARSTKELENFLWNMEQYFKVAHISNDEKILITNMYLSRNAKL